MEGKKFGALEPIHGFKSTAHGSVPKAMFRILCVASENVVKQLKESTKSIILVEKCSSDSTFSVIKIVDVVGSTFWVKLGEQEGEVEVSKAQHALIMAFEVVNVFHAAGNVSCRLLIEVSYVGAVIGEDGKLIERIMEETGSNVLVFSDVLLSCANPGDIMVKISGNVSAVKKALVFISTRLQACQSTDRAFQETLHRLMVPQDAFHRTMDVVPRDASYRSRQYREVDPRDYLHRHSQRDALSRSFNSFSLAPFQRPIGTITQETLSQPRIDSISSRTSVHSLSASASPSEFHPVTIKQHSLPPLKDYKRQVVLKILCSNERASWVIGKGGSFIMALQSETGVSINVGDILADCDERLITITASEKYGDRNSPAHRAIILLFSRFYENATENDSITARLVVPSNQIGSLLGKRFHKVSEMEKRSRVIIQVLEGEKPKCVADNNIVVQISGKLPNVKEAMNHVTRMLLENFPYQSSDVTSRPVDADPCIRPQYPFPNMFTPTAGYAPNFGPRSTMDLNNIYRHSSHTPFLPPIHAAPRGVYDGSRGLPSTRADLGLERGFESSNVTDTTVEYRVPENAVDFVCGPNCLQELREVSGGARIRVLEVCRGTRDRIIAISGTPRQIQTARTVLHALIQIIIEPKPART